MSQSQTKLKGKHKDIKSSSMCPFPGQSTLTVGSPLSLRTGNEYFNSHSFSFPLIKTPLTSWSVLGKRREWINKACFPGQPNPWAPTHICGSGMNRAAWHPHGSSHDAAGKRSLRRAEGRPEAGDSGKLGSNAIERKDSHIDGEKVETQKLNEWWSLKSMSTP